MSTTKVPRRKTTPHIPVAVRLKKTTLPIPMVVQPKRMLHIAVAAWHTTMPGNMWLKTIGRGWGGHSCKPNLYLIMVEE